MQGSVRVTVRVYEKDMTLLGWNYKACIFLYSVALFYLSSAPVPDEVNPGIQGLDKVVHAAMYGILTAIISIGMYRGGYYKVRWQWWLLPPALASLCGAMLELYQAWLPHRSYDPWDMVANTTGSMFMQLCIWLFVSLLPLSRLAPSAETGRTP